MRIKLIDIDSKIPNLALMQLSAYHKQKGDTTGFDVEDPDIIYVSCIFTKNAGQAKGISISYPNSKVILGGTGINIKLTLPQEAQKIKPDYSLYPDSKYTIESKFYGKYSLGFTTRGCIRKCPFCFVPEKEGKLHRWQHISEFHDPNNKIVICLDNNITADKEWFFENTDFILENKLKFNAIQGMDIRLLTEEIAERISKLKWAGQIHFAWDNMKDERSVINGINILKQYGINVRSKVQFYVLVGFNTTIEEDIYRCNKLKELNTNPYVMPYKRTPEINALYRWANRKQLFWTHEFYDYDRIPKPLKPHQNDKKLGEF